MGLHTTDSKRQSIPLFASSPQGCVNFPDSSGWKPVAWDWWMIMKRLPGPQWRSDDHHNLLYLIYHYAQVVNGGCRRGPQAANPSTDFVSIPSSIVLFPRSALAIPYRPCSYLCTGLSSTDSTTYDITFHLWAPGTRVFSSILPVGNPSLVPCA